MDSQYVKGHKIRRKKPQYLLTTDASTTGWGAVLRDMAYLRVLGRKSGKWSRRRLTKEMTQLEGQATLNAIYAFADKLKGKSVLIKTDNSGLMFYLNRLGGRRENLQGLMNQVLNEIHRQRIRIVAEWIPSLDNEADWLSRCSDPREEGRLKKEMLSVQGFVITIPFY